MSTSHNPIEDTAEYKFVRTNKRTQHITDSWLNAPLGEILAVVIPDYVYWEAITAQQQHLNE